MDKETYNKDLDNFVSYTNENNEDYKKHKLKLVREKDLNKKKINLGICIFLGLLTIAIALGYGFYYDKINIDLNSTCENNCEKICPSIPSCPKCPDVKCDCDLDFPDEVNFVFKNETI